MLNDKDTDGCCPMVMANRNICSFYDALGVVDGHVCCYCEDEDAADVKLEVVVLLSDDHSNVLSNDSHSRWTVAVVVSWMHTLFRQTTIILFLSVQRFRFSRRHPSS